MKVDFTKLSSIEDVNKKGLEFYKKNEYEKAAFTFKFASLYREDESFLVFHPPALFNYACVRSIQYGKGKYDNYNEIMTFLSWAVDHDVKWLNKSRKDKDLDPIRNTEGFNNRERRHSSSMNFSPFEY